MVKSFIRLIHLGIHIDKNFTWKHHINNVAIKLSKANKMLSKVRDYVEIKTFKINYYHAIFESHLSYHSLVWAQNSSSIKKSLFYKKKSLRLMLFLNRNIHADPLFKNLKTLKFSNKEALENCLLILNLLIENY